MEDINYRSFDIAEVNPDERTIEGVLAPYGDTYNSVNGYQERYERGVFGEVKDTPLYYNHDHRDNHSATVIGKVIETRDDEHGLHIKARISTTPKAEEVYTLLRDGSLTGLSAGFVGLEKRNDEGVTVWTRAHLLEASVVPDPAYKAAAISRVRSANNTKEVSQREIIMETETPTSADVVQLRNAVETLDKKVASLSVAENDAPALPQFRSIGAYVKAVASGELTEEQYRVYTGMTSAVSVLDKQPVANHIQLLDKGRKVMSLFTKEALPAQGNSVDYYVLNTNTLQAGIQAAEGDNLPSGAVSFTAATAPVKTIGGWAPLSRQAVERAQLPLLDTVYRGLGLAYAQTTEGVVRTALGAATGTNTASLGALSSATFANWSDLIVDSAVAIEDNTGLDAEFVMVSPDVYKALVKLVDTTGRPLVNVNGDGSNTIGNARIPGLSGSIFGLGLVEVSGLAAKTVWVANSSAITTFESPGAPFRLQDSDVVALTEQFSLYGYIAVAVTQPKALVKVTVT